MFGWGAFKRCPYCGGKVRIQALKCRFCGQFLEAEAEARGACVACRVMLVICMLILLAWLVVFFWQSSMG